MITKQIKTKIIQIVNAFETGSIEGKYDKISIFADGKNSSRQITYGRSQTTEQGNLVALLELYLQMGGVFSNEFQPFMSKVGKRPLVDSKEFKTLLRRAAQDDEIMRNAQDDFFDTVYYLPAFHFFQGNQFTLPLSLLVIYDSQIHSGGVLSLLRNRFTELPPLKGGDEKEWVKAYVKVRHNWLSNHSKKLLRNTKYRTQCFINQFNNDNWALEKTVIANGIQVK